MITVVGIGNDRGDITAKGKRAIKNADYVFSKYKNVYAHECASDIFKYDMPEMVIDMDIATHLQKKDEQGKNVVYLSNGDGYSDSVVFILGKNINIIPGVADNRGRKYSPNIVSMSAYNVNEQTYFDTALPHLIYGIDDEFVASDIKLALLNYYDAQEKVTLSYKKVSEVVPLCEIDHKKITNACLYIDAKSDFLSKKRYEFNDLIRIMRRLTAPDGCPWDKEQTHESIRINMLEEAYEAVDAIDSGDIDNFIEELGDVLLQVVFHCDMSEREGEFNFNDVVSGVCEKLVSRHTHIFGEDSASDSQGALDAWEKAKAKEKQASTFEEQINRIPDTFPSTLFTQKMIKKAKKYGAKIEENDIVEKLESAIKSKDGARILFLSTVYATLLGLDAETELNAQSKTAYQKAKTAEERGEMEKLGEIL